MALQGRVEELRPATGFQLGYSGRGLRGRNWKRFLRSPDPMLLEELYVPLLGEAVRYDRSCGYFSSSVLSAAARAHVGFKMGPRPFSRGNLYKSTNSVLSFRINRNGL